MESIFWLDSIWRRYSIFCVLEHFEADFTRQNDHFKECLAAATKLHFFGNFFFWGLPKYKKEQFEGGSIIFFDFIPPLELGYWTTSSQEDMEQLVYEEYDTEEQEVLAIVLENEYVNVIRECPSSWVTGRWSITGPDLIPQLLLTSHKPGGCPSQELCDGGVCLGWEVDHSLLCKHPLPGQSCGQKHWHQAFIALEVNDKLKVFMHMTTIFFSGGRLII